MKRKGGIICNQSEPEIPFKTEQKSYNRSETFGWIVGGALLLGMLALSIWAFFFWKG